MVDSGSTDTAVPGPGLNYYSGTDFYDTSGKTPIISNVKASYMDGSFWFGNFYKDYIKLGNISAEVIFAAMTKQVSI
jgi:hypothetical protein